MLAFTIGSLYLPKVNRTGFEGIFNSLCTAFKRHSPIRRNATCANFSANDYGIEAELERETEDYRHEYCMERRDNGKVTV
jgi:hypothetical protein